MLCVPYVDGRIKYSDRTVCVLDMWSVLLFSICGLCWVICSNIAIELYILNIWSVLFVLICVGGGDQI